MKPIRQGGMTMKLESIVSPVVNFVDTVVPMILLILGIVGVVYLLYLIVRLLLTPWRKKSDEMAHIYTVLATYFIVPALVYLLGVYTPALINLVAGEETNFREVKVDFSEPLNNTIVLFNESVELVKNGKASENVVDSLKKIHGAGNTLLHEEMEGIPEAIEEIGENLPNIQGG